MTPAARTRLKRVRASAGIVKLALQQIEDELAGDIDAQELAEILRELHREADPQEGLFGALAQLLTVAARTAERIEPDHDGDASCPLHEAAALVTEDAGLQAYYATRALDPQGERAP
ncbi:hypothetical protein GCM10017744_103800 [Streptomyces antimycoticus]|uniref:Uncharacterized protein n=1 Tax=Streptomyces antimycoticus TaxID=68175 RepID=A0A4D4KJI2_9ACTN|nr:hypothetical protein [Streptomyces antimycoticus]GDY49105.1 hypothetical protein SANT12839_099870 [Streptomyces antimycoticus]